MTTPNDSPHACDTCCPPPRDPASTPTLTPEQERDQLATFCNALGHPTRVAIMQILIQRERCICGEIVEELPIAQSTVSRHLAKLKEAGLIRGEIDGPRVCYCVEPAALQLFAELSTKLQKGL